MTRVSRRMFLKTAVTGAAVVSAPVTLRAQAKTFKIGAVHPVTGPLAEPGQACRLGAQMAVEAVNAAGGIKSKGGLKLELIVGDTQTALVTPPTVVIPVMAWPAAHLIACPAPAAFVRALMLKQLVPFLSQSVLALLLLVECR